MVFVMLCGVPDVCLQQLAFLVNPTSLVRCIQEHKASYPVVTCFSYTSGGPCSAKHSWITRPRKFHPWAMTDCNGSSIVSSCRSRELMDRASSESICESRSFRFSTTSPGPRPSSSERIKISFSMVSGLVVMACRTSMLRQSGEPSHPEGEGSGSTLR